MRPGASSVAELLLVAWLFALVLGGVARFAHSQNRLAALQRDRLRVEEALRTGKLVLSGELRFQTPGDVAAHGDSLRIRAFRGGGEVCGVDAGGALHVRYRGMRQPEPDKDSLLVVTRVSVEPARLVSWSRSMVCAGGLQLSLEAPTDPGAAYLLLYETGAYSLAAGAIRYRRGGGGRQPLTEAIFRDLAIESAPGRATFRFTADPDSLRGLQGSSWSFDVVSLNGPHRRTGSVEPGAIEPSAGSGVLHGSEDPGPP
jgi:hypothetical protein